MVILTYETLKIASPSLDHWNIIKSLERTIVGDLTDLFRTLISRIRQAYYPLILAIFD